jgi:hypothetical protein
MVINFRARGISRGTPKLARASMLIKKIILYFYMIFISLQNMYRLLYI